MPNTIESYNARFIIADHFDLIINLIDQITEEILCNCKEQNCIDLINKLREEQILKIELLKSENLKNTEQIQSSFEEKWEKLIKEKSIDYNQKLEIFKRDLIRQDCVIVEDSKYIIGHTIWITKWFNDKKMADFLRFLFFSPYCIFYIQLNLFKSYSLFESPLFLFE